MILFGAASLTLFSLPMSKAWGFRVNASAYTLHIGDSADIPVHYDDITACPYFLDLQDRKKDRLVFTSSDELVVTVDNNGTLTAVGEGEAVITASLSDQVREIAVTSYVPGESLTFKSNTYTLTVGEQQTLSTALRPEEAVLFDKLTFASSDEGIVSIDEKGCVTAMAPGTAEVSVTADGLTGTARIRVLQPMTGIAIRGLSARQEITMERGESRRFLVDYFPENTTGDRTVTYHLSDPDQGTVDSTGLFTATGRGEVLLTVRCGSFSASVVINIRVPLKGIELLSEGGSLVYPTGTDVLWRAIPEDTTDELRVFFDSTNTKVLTVDENGFVTPQRGGEADVVLRVNGLKKSCSYSVSVPITSMWISTGSVFLYAGTSTRVSAGVEPSFTTEDKSISWTSDNPGIATVNASGAIYAVSPGVTWIRATHGSFQVACRVEVQYRPGWEETADAIIAFGKQYLGTRYVYGGESLTGGIDCSSFTQQCFASQRIYISRTSYSQVTQGSAVSLDPSAWRKGDLIFYSPEGSVSHVAIYIGDGQILQSSQSQGGVVISAYNYNGLTPSHVRRYF